MPEVVVVVVWAVPPPGVEVAVGAFGLDDTFCDGVTETSWKTSFTAWNTTTIAG